MLNRRHIRVKVMQSIYAMHQSNSDDMVREEKFLFQSIENIRNLYLIIISALVEIRNSEEQHIERISKKHLATAEERNPNRKFVNNRVLKLLEENESVMNALEESKVDNWKKNDDYILLLLDAIRESDVYNNYMQSDEDSFEEDRRFVHDLFVECLRVHQPPLIQGLGWRYENHYQAQ